MMRRDPHNLKPCPHMQILVSAWLDDQLDGLLRRYTAWHIRHCPRCASAIPVLQALRKRLRCLPDVPDAPPLSPERRAAVQEAWERADRAATSPGSHAP